MMRVIGSKFKEFGYNLDFNHNIIPNDQSTLFVCSGMQNLKQKFTNPDNTKLGSIQDCIRTIDLEEVGDGSHLTFFQMIGSFSFGLNNYKEHVQMWHEIMMSLGLKRSITSVHYHPYRDDMRLMWSKLGYKTEQDESCIWSDGNIKGHCTELYVGNLEIGNLVNPLEHSVDVGFGLERLIQVIEGVPRVDDTSLFNTTLDPITRDHVRTLELLWNSNIEPGNKGRNYITRRLIRRILPKLKNFDFKFNSWLKSEQELRESVLRLGKSKWSKFKDRDNKFWWETYGILPEEIKLLY